MQLYLIRVPKNNNYRYSSDDKYDYTKSSMIKKLERNDIKYIIEEVRKVSSRLGAIPIDDRVISYMKDTACNYRITEDIFLYNPECTYEHDKEEIEIINLAIRKNKLNQICD